MPKPKRRRRATRDEPAVMMSGLSMSNLTPERIRLLNRWSAHGALMRQKANALFYNARGLPHPDA